MKNSLLLFIRTTVYSLLAVTCLLFACQEDEEINPAPDDFNYPNFQTSYGLNLLGTATIVTEKIRNKDTVLVRLARADEQYNYEQYEYPGGCWYARSRMSIEQGFETTFRFKPSISNSPRAFSFVIQNAGQDSLGKVGEITSPGYGYVAPSNSLTVGFSTRQQNIRIFSRDTTLNSAFILETETFSVPALINVAEGHEVRIAYESGTLTIFLNGEEVATAEDLNLEELLKLSNGKAYVGFTAVTDADGPNHDILSWSFKPLKE